MKADHWHRLKELFKVALPLDPEKRTTYLEEACRGDPGLRAEVEALLAADGKAAEFMELSLAKDAPALEETDEIGAEPDS